MSELVEVKVPDIGDFDEVDVIEVLVAPGDEVQEDASLISLESDKATMDVPAPRAGTVREVKVSAGDKVAQGSLILMLEPAAAAGEAEGSARDEEAAGEAPEAPSDEPETPAKPGKGAAQQEEGETEPPEPPDEEGPAPKVPREAPDLASREVEIARRERTIDEAGFARAYASPAVRRFARELGADLGQIEGSGRKGRIVKEDVQRWVKAALAEPRGAAAGAAGGALSVAPAPAIDFSKFGPVEAEPLTKIQRLTGQNLHRSWVTIPHVTQFDEADITEMEAFRKEMAGEAERRGVKLTPIPFLVKAVVAGLREFPRFNSSLSADGESLVKKSYFHIGIAVDTPAGLMVPVIRDADQMGLFELAAKLSDLASRARERKLKPDEMQGGSLTISSLGGLGGTAFTPIVNPPEVAILGVSKARMQPVWREEEGGFEPRLMLPLALSYDHRVIDGVAGARFTTYLAQVLGDLRRLLL